MEDVAPSRTVAERDRLKVHHRLEHRGGRPRPAFITASAAFITATITHITSPHPLRGRVSNVKPGSGSLNELRIRPEVGIIPQAGQRENHTPNLREGPVC